MFYSHTNSVTKSVVMHTCQTYVRPTLYTVVLNKHSKSNSVLCGGYMITVG